MQGLPSRYFGGTRIGELPLLTQGICLVANPAVRGLLVSQSVRLSVG